MAATKGSLAGAMREESAGFKISLCLVWMYSKYKLNSNENFINFTLPKCACVCFGGVMIKGKGWTAGGEGSSCDTAKQLHLNYDGAQSIRVLRVPIKRRDLYHPFSDFVFQSHTNPGV